MVGLKGALCPLLLDPGYWGERLREEAAVPLRPLVLHRESPTVSGDETFEILVNGLDGLRLRAVLVRHPERQCPGVSSVRLHIGPIQEGQESPPEGCEADLYFDPPQHKRLEERVLDTLRVLKAARAVEGLAVSKAEAVPEGPEAPPDEFLIAQGLLERGWV